MTRVTVGDASEIGPGERRFLEVDGNPICVFNHDGEYYGILNECPHRGGVVGAGEILPEEGVEEPGSGRRSRDVFTDRTVITCPWHGWEFDIETGEHAGDPTPAHSLPTFDVTVEDGEVVVEV